MPEELSDEDPPTVTPTPVCGSPVCPTSEALLRPSSDETKVQIIGSEDVNIVSDQKSNIQKDLAVELSSKLEDQHSEHLLSLEDRINSQENLSSFKHVSSSINEQNQYSSSEAKETSKAEDVIKPLTKSYSAAIGFKTSPHPNNRSLFGDPTFSPDSEAFSSNKEAPMQDAEASSPLAVGYHDDFELSVDSSPKEEHHSYKSESQNSVSPNEIKGSRKDSPARTTSYDSQDEEIEEEIAEELSHHSGTSEPSHQSERLLDLDKQTVDSKHDNKSINFSHSPPISPVKTPLSPVVDEMASFNIGDRVLVGGVQPGTLKFKGPTSFAHGFWAGVELDKSEGSNNGTYDGVVYFGCDERHGIFAPPDKITHLPDKFETYTDTTEDEDSFFDDFTDKGGDKPKTDEDKSQEQGNLKNEKEQKSHKDFRDKKMTDDSVHKNQATLKAESHLNSQLHKESMHPIPNGNSRNIMLEFEDVTTTLLISDMNKIGLEEPSQKVITTLVEREESQHQVTSDLTPVIKDKGEQDTDLLDTFTDNLFNNFVKDAINQFAEIKKAKGQKIEAANQMNGDLFGENVEGDEWVSSVEQKDGLPFFLPAEKEELSSPELCNRPVSVYFSNIRLYMKIKNSCLVLVV